MLLCVHLLPGRRWLIKFTLKNKNQMNLMSRKRNAGVAPKFWTMWVPIPITNTAGGSNIGNCCRLLPAFLFSLVFTVRPTFEKTIGAYKRTENSAASPLVAITDCSALWLQICHRHICLTRRAPGEAVYLNQLRMLFFELTALLQGQEHLLFDISLFDI